MSDLSMELRAHSLAEIFCRCFGTFVAALLAAIGAETMHVAWVMIGIGVSFDVFRNLFAPDLTVGEKELAKSIASATRDPIVASGYKTKLRKWAWIIYGVWAGYTIIFSLVEPIVSPHLMKIYLEFFEPLYKAVALVFTIAREHPRELMEHGYPYRALVVSHIYTFNWIMFVFSLGSEIFSRANYRAHPKKLTVDYIMIVRAGKWQDLLPRLAVCLLFLLFFYVGISYGLSLGWNHKLSRPWAVQSTNAQFPMLAGGLFTAEYFFSYLYSYLIVYRAGRVYRHGDESVLRPDITETPRT